MFLLLLFGFYLLGVILAYPIVFAAERADSESCGFGEDSVIWPYKDDRNQALKLSLCSWAAIAVIISMGDYHGFRWK